MSEKTKPTVLILYPYVFREFDWQRFELSILSRYCHVLVHELIMLSEPLFLDAYQDKSYRPEIMRFNSLSAWVCYFIKLRNSTHRSDLYIIDFFKLEKKISTLLIKSILLFSGARVIIFNSPGIPEYAPSLLEKNLENNCFRLFAKFLHYHGSRAYYSLLGSRGHFLSVDPRPPAFLLSSNGSCKINYHLASSFDYSNFLTSKTDKKVNLSGTYAVLIDGAGPLFASDDILLGRKSSLTSEKWYPALCGLFDFLEVGFVDQVVIVAHPKVCVSADYRKKFDDRVVFQSSNDRFITETLIGGADFVITRISTAVSFAVIYEKPILFVVSDELKKDSIFVKKAQCLYQELNKKPINIDGFSNDEVIGELVVKDQVYDAYRRKFLSNSGNYTNSEIILRDVMKLRTLI